MGDSSPSLQDWEKLYEAAMEFKEIESWNWMWDSDIFGVQNPENDEIGYCCIMGRMGEHFALAVYLGTEGLDGYLRIQSGEILPGDVDILHLQKCLMASFEDRDFLQKPDLQVIKELGLKFRGRNSWPLFRSYRPGYHPWYLTKEILVTKEEISKLLKPITSRLGINLKLVKKLMAIEEAKHSMFDFFALD